MSKATPKSTKQVKRDPVLALRAQVRKSIAQNLAAVTTKAA